MTDRERLIELISHQQDYGVVYERSQMDERKVNIAEVFNSTLADYLLSNGVILPSQPKPQTDLKGKCGSCVYAIPASFGKSRVYVECTNVEHIGTWCKRTVSYKRQRTHPACKRYQERSVDDA